MRDVLFSSLSVHKLHPSFIAVLKTSRTSLLLPAGEGGYSLRYLLIRPGGEKQAGGKGVGTAKSNGRGAPEVQRVRVRQTFSIQL